MDVSVAYPQRRGWLIITSSTTSPDSAWVVDAGGFTPAGRRHGVPKSTLSRRIKALEDSNRVMKKLGDSPQCLVAAPELLDAARPARFTRGTGATTPPARDHRACASPWHLRDALGSEQRIRHSPRLVTDDMRTLRAAALDGLGVVQLPLLVTRDALQSGILERVLPDWAPRPDWSMPCLRGGVACGPRSGNCSISWPNATTGSNSPDGTGPWRLDTQASARAGDLLPGAQQRKMTLGGIEHSHSAANRETTMHISTTLFSAAVLAVAVMAPAQAQDARPAMKKHTSSALRCMDPNRIDEWHVIDARTVTVRNGPYRYVITTQHKCQRLGRFGASIRFHLSESDKAGLGRICGGVGEMVSSRAQPPCAIATVKKISKARFNALDRKAKRSGNGAAQPGMHRGGH